MSAVRRSIGRSVVVTCVVVASGLGCREEAVQPGTYSGPANQCTDTCTSGATCVDGTCVVAATSYPFVLEVTPPSTSSFAPGLTYTISIADRSGGARDLTLATPAQIDVLLFAARATDTSTTIARTLVATRTGWVPGLATRALTTRWDAATYAAASTEPPLELPPDEYDLVVTPTDAADVATTPPWHVGARSLASGPFTLERDGPGALATYNFTLVDTSTGLPLTALSPAHDVTIVDAISGLRLGTVSSTCGDAGYATVLIAPSDVTSTSEVRVSPPTSTCAGAEANAVAEPTYHVNLEDLDIDGSGGAAPLTLRVPNLGITPPTALPPGTVYAFSTNEPVAAQMVLTSTALAQDTLVHSGRSYVIAYGDSAADGELYLTLPAGSYVATVVPDLASGNATRLVPFDIGGSGPLPTFEVYPLAQMIGSVTDPSGVPFGLGTIELLPTTTPLVAGASLDQARARTAPLSALASATALDPGTYDLVFHVPAPSLYPWIVMPNVVVPEPLRASPTFDVGALTPTLPVVMTGRLLAPGGAAIANAAIRAKALIPGADGITPIAAVEIGEATSDALGSYTLRLPSALTPAPIQPDAGLDAATDATSDAATNAIDGGDAGDASGG